VHRAQRPGTPCIMDSSSLGAFGRVGKGATNIVVGELGLAIIKLCTRFNISTFTHYEDMKGDENAKNWSGLGVKGH